MKYYIQLLFFGILMFNYSFLIKAEDEKIYSINNEIMKKSYKGIITRLKEFKDTGKECEIYTLVEIKSDIDSFPVPRKTDDIKNFNIQRKLNFELYCRFLNKIDELIDPKFDPDDSPERNVGVPAKIRPFIGVRKASSGMDPKVIKNLKYRKIYEEAIEKNRKKSIYYNFQYKLRRLDKSCFRGIDMHIGNCYTSKEEDINEIKTLIDTHITSETRKKTLKEKFAKDTSNIR